MELWGKIEIMEGVEIMDQWLVIEIMEGEGPPDRDNGVDERTSIANYIYYNGYYIYDTTSSDVSKEMYNMDKQDKEFWAKVKKVAEEQEIEQGTTWDEEKWAKEWDTAASVLLDAMDNEIYGLVEARDNRDDDKMATCIEEITKLHEMLHGIIG